MDTMLGECDVVRCPACAKEFSVGGNSSTFRGRCPHCRAKVTVFEPLDRDRPRHAVLDAATHPPVPLEKPPVMPFNGTVVLLIGFMVFATVGVIGLGGVLLLRERDSIAFVLMSFIGIQAAATCGSALVLLQGIHMAARPGR